MVKHIPLGEEAARHRVRRSTVDGNSEWRGLGRLDAVILGVMAGHGSTEASADKQVFIITVCHQASERSGNINIVDLSTLQMDLLYQ